MENIHDKIFEFDKFVNVPKGGTSKSNFKDLANRLKYKYLDFRYETIQSLPRKKKKKMKNILKKISIK